MVGYKVVKLEGRRLVSPIANGTYGKKCYYRKYKTTKSPQKHNPLYCFRTKQAAEDYIVAYGCELTIMPPLFVFECEIVPHEDWVGEAHRFVEDLDYIILADEVKPKKFV